jgi:hypothetical protein
MKDRRKRRAGGGRRRGTQVWYVKNKDALLPPDESANIGVEEASGEESTEGARETGTKTEEDTDTEGKFVAAVEEGQDPDDTGDDCEQGTVSAAKRTSGRQGR